MLLSKQRVCVAMSGGVDSSVAALLLKEQGFDVIGVTMQIWPAVQDFGGCCSLSAIEDARRVAAGLEIPHYVVNFREEFKEQVIADFIHEYQAGRTPNPCVRCNQLIKFDLLINKARELGADKIATGHYARITGDNPFQLLKGIDTHKDQSYVLYMLNQQTLPRVVFPLGNLTKEAVREIARENNLTVAEKKESQEICFVEDDDYVRFLKENCPAVVRPGKIIDKTGKVVGQHAGIAFYTLGQRKGIGAHSSTPKYVIKIDALANTIMIGDSEDTLGSELTAREVSFVGGGGKGKPLEVSAKIRYNSSAAEAVLYPGQADSIKVIFKQPQRSITPGQSVVFYRGEEVLGGGIING